MEILSGLLDLVQPGLNMMSKLKMNIHAVSGDLNAGVACVVTRYGHNSSVELVTVNFLPHGTVQTWVIPVWPGVSIGGSHSVIYMYLSRSSPVLWGQLHVINLARTPNHVDEPYLGVLAQP